MRYTKSSVANQISMKYHRTQQRFEYFELTLKYSTRRTVMRWSERSTEISVSSATISTAATRVHLVTCMCVCVCVCARALWSSAKCNWMQTMLHNGAQFYNGPRLNKLWTDTYSTPIIIDSILDRTVSTVWVWRPLALDQRTIWLDTGVRLRCDARHSLIRIFTRHVSQLSNVMLILALQPSKPAALYAI